MSNREIKFRALKDDMSDCNFVYGYLIKTPDGIPRITSDVGGLFHTCIKGTEGQYTGLKDKNGKEIYEGDIIKTESGKIGNVIFNNGCFYTPIEESNYRLGGWKTGRVEIIGNIYETPNLIIV